MKNHNLKNSGFTLIELMIVIAIIIILAATSIIFFNPIEKQKEQRDALRVSTISQIASQLEIYYSEKKKYPASLGDLTDPTTGINVRISLADPVTNCSLLYVVDSSSPIINSYQIYAVKESKNFNIPKGQGLISEVNNNQTMTTECPSASILFKIEGGVSQ